MAAEESEIWFHLVGLLKPVFSRQIVEAASTSLRVAVCD
jgi:hypothetical protein